MYRMDIERKFKESKYFLNQLEKLEHTPEEMIYNLNAFLSSSKKSGMRGTIYTVDREVEMTNEVFREF